MEQYPRITLSRDVFPQVVMRGVRPFVEGAFENLLLNAVEAQKYVGQVSVSCTQVRGGRSGKSLDVFICDNGPGVKLDVRDKVKEGQQITTKGAGRGLGLVIARLSVLECHGELELLPIPLPGWRGACFRVSLPVQRRRQRT